MKYKVGDRVVGVGTCEGKNIDGITGTVRGVLKIGYPNICIEFDTYIDGHTGSLGCTKPGKHGHCWYVDQSNLRPLHDAHNDKHKIVITTDGKTTLARLYDGKRVVKSAEAKCAPSDTFDFATGAKLAFGRLMGNEKAEAPKQEPIRLYCVKDKTFGCLLTKGKVYELKIGGASIEQKMLL